MRIALVAGELSGDTLGAGLIRTLAERFPNATFEGIGGPGMQAAGLDAWYDCEVLAVMGLTEVLAHLPRLLKLRRELVQRWTTSPPDVFVGIDAPDFNIGLELRLRRGGVPTVHYVSPSVWAWREKRVNKIARACDRVLCLLPFEPAFYERHNVAADFVGHPLATRIEPTRDVGAARDAMGLRPEQPVVTVLPGSRRGEIERVGADFLKAALQLIARNPSLQVLVPLASASGRTHFDTLDAARDLSQNVRVSVGDAHQCIAAADVLLCASGTVTLEGLLHGKPMVVGYRLAASTFRIVRLFKLVKLKYYSLPNLLTPTPLVPEFIQHDMTPEALSAAVQALLDDPQRRASIAATFASVHNELSRNADVRAADAVTQVARPHG
ncbi:MAG: lipid-A-disaccharide synthase [Pseudomonadota bacterium]